MAEQEVPAEAAEAEGLIQDEPAEEAASEEEVVEDSEESPESIEPRKKTAQERINEITRKRRDAERDAEYWRKTAMEKNTTPEPTESKKSDRPQLEHFESQEEYEDALLTWHEGKRDAKTAEATERKRQSDAVSAFNKRAAKMRAQYDDFDEALEAPVFSSHMRTVLMESESGPELAYYLGSPENIETAEKILSLSPEAQIYELGRLETQVKLSKKTKKTTTAPKPISPVGSTGAPEKDTSKMTMDEWMEWDKKRRLERIESQFK